MKELIAQMSRSLFVGCLLGFLIGATYGGYSVTDKVYNDCRHAGVTRIGEAAFKCEQFSKVVMLLPDGKK